MIPPHEVATGADAAIDARNLRPRADEATRHDQPGATQPGPIYVRALQAVSPRLLRMLTPPPWTAEASRRPGRGLSLPAVQLRRQSAALALALHAERGAPHPDAPAMQEHVRCALIAWQLSLRGDGLPVCRRARTSSVPAAVAASVTQLLSDLPWFANEGLLEDLRRHLRWLSGRHEASSWLEASAIGALSDGAALLDDKLLRRCARQRLRHLLTRQNVEGWFPEHGGVDPGRLSLTIDVMARARARQDWEETSTAIQRAISFLAQVVHPDGTIGAAVGTCGFGFVSPYAVELMAHEVPDAARLARACRQRYAGPEPARTQAWSDDLCALLASRLASAEPVARRELPARQDGAQESRGIVRFPHAGYTVCTTDAYHAVVSGCHGGAFDVHWRAEGDTFDDPGLTVALGPTIRMTGRFDPAGTVDVTPTSVTYHGMLRRAARPRRSRLQRLMRMLLYGRVGRRLKVQQHVSRSLPAVARRLHAPLNRFQRTITFGDDWLAVHDDIHCRRRCRAVVCHAGTSAGRGRWADRGAAAGQAQTPIFIEGAKEVRLTRLFRNGRLLDVRITRDGREENAPTS